MIAVQATQHTLTHIVLRRNNIRANRDLVKIGLHATAVLPLGYSRYPIIPIITILNQLQ